LIVTLTYDAGVNVFRSVQACGGTCITSGPRFGTSAPSGQNTGTVGSNVYWDTGTTMSAGHLVRFVADQRFPCAVS